MKYLSLFSGIGGFELGIKQAYEANLSVRNGEATTTETKTIQPGLEPTSKSDEFKRDSPNNLGSRNSRPLLCIGFSEIDKYAVKIYQHHFPEHKAYGDITKINETELPDFDLLVGGFPCQSFSIAGKRGGFNDTRGTMFFEIARILKHKQPRLLLLENVKGLLSHDEGRTFATIISTLDELGYDLQWQVLNSKNFGVPQNRERVFIVGHLRGTSRPKVFPFARDNGEDIEIVRYDTQRPQGIATRHLNRNGGLKSEIASTVQVAEIPHVIESGRQDNQEVRIESDNSNSGRQEAHSANIRRLTPTECARLQGFPDHWHKVEGISDTQAYKCYGNAVTVNVIKEIISKLASTPQ